MASPPVFAQTFRLQTHCRHISPACERYDESKGIAMPAELIDE
jgi:hypothetical protein